MTERLKASLKARSIKTTEELEKILINLCKGANVFTYMGDINNKKNTLFKQGSDLSTTLTTFLDKFREEVITACKDKETPLEETADLNSVIEAVKLLDTNTYEDVVDHVKNFYDIRSEIHKIKALRKINRPKLLKKYISPRGFKIMIALQLEPDLSDAITDFIQEYQDYMKKAYNKVFKPHLPYTFSEVLTTIQELKGFKYFEVLNQVLDAIPGIQKEEAAEAAKAAIENKRQGGYHGVLMRF